MTELPDSCAISQINALRSQMNVLAHHLEEAVERLRSGCLPDLSEAIARWEPLASAFANLAETLQPSERSLDGLAAAAKARTSILEAMAIIERLERLSHHRDPNFSMTIINRRCGEAREALARRAIEQELEEVMRPLRALARLVDEGESLDEAELGPLEEQVRIYFDQIVSLAATRGRLFVAEIGGRSQTEEGLMDCQGGIQVASPPPFGESGGGGQQDNSHDPHSARPATDCGLLLASGSAPVGVVLNSSNSSAGELEKASTDATISKEPQKGSPSAKPLGVARPAPTDRYPLSPIHPPVEAPFKRKPLASLTLKAPDLPERPGDAGDMPLADNPSGTKDSVPTVALDSPPPAETACAVPADNPPPLPPSELDGQLHSFEAFRSAFWLAPSGQIEPVPWHDAVAFVQRIEPALDKALANHQFGVAFLFVQALAALSQGRESLLDNWRCAEAVSESPYSASAGASTLRAQYLASVAHLGGNAPEVKLALLLEAVRPSNDPAITVNDLESLTAAFQDQRLRRAIDYLLRCNLLNIRQPLENFKAKAAKGGASSREESQRQLKEDSQALRERIKVLWSAAGGKIKQTHCQKAWSDFIDQVVKPLRDSLPGEGESGTVLAGRLQNLRSKLKKFQSSYERIMDKAEVKLNDRHIANRCAKELEDGFSRVVDLTEQLHNMADNPMGTTPAPVEEVQYLREAGTLTEIEELCRQLLLGLIDKRETRLLRLSARWLRDYPTLIGEIDSDEIRDPRFIDNGLSCRVFRAPLAAAAVLVDADFTLVATKPSSNLKIEICQQAMEAMARRPDLGACIAHLSENHDRDRIQRVASELEDKVFQASKELANVARQCQGLNLPLYSSLKMATEEARKLADQGITRQGILQGLMLQAWIQALRSVAESVRDAALDSYRWQTASGPTHSRLLKLEELITKGRLHLIPSLLSGQQPNDAHISFPEWRRTPWRTAEQLQEFSKSWMDNLERRGQECGGEIEDLIQMWLNPPTNPQTTQKLRRLFYRMVSGEEGIGQARRKRVIPDGLVRGGFDTAKIRIQCKIIRKMFREAGLNPIFLPQIADYSEILLLSAPTVRSDGIVTDYARSATAENKNALVVFVAPKLGEAGRSEILRGFRQRGISAAVVDDFDFWRLVRVDDSLGHDFVPFLEIVMEQLKLDRVSPFSSQDGQHVRLETYVGRRDEALKLAKTVDYSRVFSGRKLGKSALLKQVEVVYDKTSLPSGSRLNVLFITIAGGDSENWIVENIIGEMGKRFQLEEPSNTAHVSPSERFSKFVAKFIESQKDDSLLIILDEADQFVEGQLAHYDRDRENSLSFKMMKELPTQVDDHNFPRVRVILSGYRITHTREGVWANAGDVLRLRPLQEEEAVQFIQGAMARIGIDIAEHASFIARRCGFQPAILIRFGKILLKRLETQRSPHILGEHIRVDYEDVADTFNDPDINEEIRTVVQNNFQGNRLGGVIFDALLLVMQSLPPGYPLLEASSQILDKLREIQPDLSWLTRIDPTPEAEIKRNLRDFIARELLTEESQTSAAEPAYRLRFPHYLPVLTQQTDLSRGIRQRIDALMQTPVRRRVGCVLSESALETIRYCYDENTVETCQLAVVGGGWLKALDHPKVGVADRLGFCERVHSGQNPQECERLAKQATRPEIVISGIEAMRWARRQYKVGVLRVEPVPVLRITDASIAWWFEDMRALDFKHPNAVGRIAQATGGIPYLLEHFDALLAHADGSEVTASELDGALMQFEGQFASYAEDLRNGPAPVRLLAREIELLAMLTHLASQGLDTKFGEDFCDNWKLSNDIAPIAAPLKPPYDDAEDDVALQVLVDAGLLSLDAQSKVQIEPDGVEARLAKAWGYAGY